MRKEAVTEKRARVIEDIAFGQSGFSVYAVIDGAAVPGLRTKISQSGCLSTCLNRGELAPEVAAASPWLIQLDRDAAFTGWILRTGWNQSWGILALAASDIATMRRHFRTFLTVALSDQRIVQFRWYDPRILRAYLPTCTADEAAIVFGPTAQFLTEGDDPEVMFQFTRADDGVSATSLTLPG